MPEEDVLIYTPTLRVELDSVDGMLELDFYYRVADLPRQVRFYLDAAQAREWGLKLLTKSKQATRKAAASHG